MTTSEAADPEKATDEVLSIDGKKYVFTLDSFETAYSHNGKQCNMPLADLKELKGKKIASIKPELIKNRIVFITIITKDGFEVSATVRNHSEEDTKTLREYFLTCWDQAVGSISYIKQPWKDLQTFLISMGWQI
jgi:hypothetical protein